jgi:histidinol-phosphate/aromatic aminotransferase/cobyric acid decarboxylase-like protein
MTPDDGKTPEHHAKNAARETFKAARTEWQNAKARIKQITSAVDNEEVTGDQRSELIAEKRRLKAGLAEMGVGVRAAKATWLKLKEAAQEANPANTG